MKKIKFKIEYVPLSDAQIEQNKDFDSLMAAYTAHPKPDWKSRFFGNKILVYLGGIITGAVFSSLIWWGVTTMQTPAPDEKGLAQNENSAQQPPAPQTPGESLAKNDNTPLSPPISRDSEKTSAENTNTGLQPSTPEGESLAQNEKTSGKTLDLQDRDQVSLAKNDKSTINSKDNKKEQKSFSSKGNQKVTAPIASVTKGAREDKSDSDDKQNEKTVSTSSGEKDDLTKTASSQLANSQAHKAANTQGGKENISATGQESSTSKPGVADSVIITEAAKENETKVDSLHNPVNPTITKELSSEKGVVSDTTRMNDNMVADTKEPESSVPGDSAAKKIQINLPKIDLNKEWDASKNAVSKVADSVGKKTGNLFARLFKSDSTKTKKPEKESSITALPTVDSFKQRFWQVSFVTPLSSDGVNGKDYVHNLSLNILQGYNGALDGVEFGGLANVEKGYVKGVQFGGLVNFAFGNVDGAQFGGLVNNGKNLHGVQFGGLINSATGSVHGLQTAGLINFAKDTLRGFQLGGVLNLCLEKGLSRGWQIGGVSNISIGQIIGGQIAGVLNVSNVQYGSQLGLINVSKQLHGFQLGLINIADSLDGDALGLISISRNGVHTIDLFGSEILYANVGLKIGSPHVYTLFAFGVGSTKDSLSFPVGLKPQNSTVRLGYGIGVGGHVPFGKGFFNIDGICWNIHNHDFRDWQDVNLWSQLRLMGGYQFTHGLAIYAGPTANVQVFNDRYPTIAPYTIFSNATGRTSVDGWIGFVFGIQFL